MTNNELISIIYEICGDVQMSDTSRVNPLPDIPQAELYSRAYIYKTTVFPSVEAMKDTLTTCVGLFGQFAPLVRSVKFDETNGSVTLRWAPGYKIMFMPGQTGDGAIGHLAQDCALVLRR